MDLGEILSYKPETSTKRSRENEDDEELPPSKTSKSSGAEGNGMSYEEKLKLLQSIDEEEEVIADLDSTGVKRLLLSFEKQVLKNQEMRVKFPDQPEKFMDSEIELNAEIQQLHVISTVPFLYNILVESHTCQTLVGLLTHDNSDIAIAVVDLLQQLTDADLEGEEEEGEGGEERMEQLIDALLAEKIIALLVQNMERLDERVREDSDGVHMSLAIVENMCEYRGEEVTLRAGEQGLVTWLLKRVRVRQYDSNKLYSSEILAIILQDNETTQRHLGETEGGIDILLQSLAYYKKRDPHSNEEVELMENLFNCLCSSLMYTPNRERFLKGEGLQLMRLMLLGKKLSRRGALKVLDHAMCNEEGKNNCIKFVEIYGLGAVFPVFMKTPKVSRQTPALTREHEEHVVSVIASLFRHTSGAVRERVMSKFTENDHEKVDRLMELHLHYSDQVRKADSTLEGGVVTHDETEVLLRRMDAGLFTLQLVDYIISELCVCGVASLRDRVQSILALRGDAVESIRRVMKGYHSQLASSGNHGNEEGGGVWLDRLNTLIKQL